MVSPQWRRQAVVVMRSEVAVSERRACGLIQIHRRTYRYVPRPEDRGCRCGCASWPSSGAGSGIGG
jgi:hypothetical protein